MFYLTFLVSRWRSTSTRVQNFNRIRKNHTKIVPFSPSNFSELRWDDSFAFNSKHVVFETRITDTLATEFAKIFHKVNHAGMKGI